MKIWFDMDGVLVGLYDVTDWLSKLRDYDPSPYAVAKPLVNLSQLARYLNKAQKRGHQIGIISWLSKDPDPDYGVMVTHTKRIWLSNHLPSVKWDEIKIVPYGVNKWESCGEGILFDDEERNRTAWGGKAYEPSEIFQILNELIKAD